MRINTKQQDSVKINSTEVEDLKCKEQAEEGVSRNLQPTQDVENKQNQPQNKRKIKLSKDSCKTGTTVWM